MVTLKRFWSGQITTSRIITKCKELGIDQILIAPATRKDEWIAFLNSDFKVALQTQSQQLNVRRNKREAADRHRQSLQTRRRDGLTKSLREPFL
jgi:hypothetical protein